MADFGRFLMDFSCLSELRSWWEVPSIAHFCSLFRDAFGLLDFDITVRTWPNYPPKLSTTVHSPPNTVSFCMHYPPSVVSAPVYVIGISQSCPPGYYAPVCTQLCTCCVVLQVAEGHSLGLNCILSGSCCCSMFEAWGFLISADSFAWLKLLRLPCIMMSQRSYIYDRFIIYTQLSVYVLTIPPENLRVSQS